MKPSFAEAQAALHAVARLSSQIDDADQHGEVVRETELRGRRREARAIVCRYLGVPYGEAE